MVQLSREKKNFDKQTAPAAVEFTIEKKTLFSALQAVQPICSRRTTIDVTANVFMHVSPTELVLRATDLEISFQASFQIMSTLTEHFQFTVHAKRLMDLIKDLDGNLRFSWDGRVLSIGSDLNKDLGITLSTSPTESFPTFPERIENLIDIDAQFLRLSINQVDQIIPSGNANPSLNGLLMQFNTDGLSLVATDGHSLARIKTDKYSLSEPKEWVIPKRAISELKKTLDLSEPERIFLGICAGQLVFSGGNFNFFTRLIADSFPDYRPVLERKDFVSGTVDKALFCSMLKRACCLLAGKFISAKFCFSKDSFEIVLNNKEIGSLKERISAVCQTGQTISSNFYSPYVLTAVQQLNSETVNFMIKEGVAPLFFDSSSDGIQATYLIMPVVSNSND